MVSTVPKLNVVFLLEHLFRGSSLQTLFSNGSATEKQKN